MTEQPAEIQTNARGEFYDANGGLFHTGGEGFQPGSGVPTFVHEGDWLSCHGCNPPKVVDAVTAEGRWVDLKDLRAAYAKAKDARDAATERFDAVKSKLQAALSEASGGAYRAELQVPGFKPMTLVYTEPWTLDTKRLKAEQPAVYVEFAKQGTRWTLAESRAK